MSNNLKEALFCVLLMIMSFIVTTLILKAHGIL